MEKFNYTVTKEDHENKLRISELVRRRFGFSSRMRSRIKREGKVMRNGEPVNIWEIPREKDLISIQLPEEVSNFEPEQIPIDVIYEDDDLFIINKQPGVVVHPTKGHPAHTIANGMANYMNETGNHFKMRFINRLDMDTSGVLLLAKSAYCQNDFMKQMERNRVEKKYTAIVLGLMENDSGEIDLPIGRPSPESLTRCVKEDGRPSVTRYNVIERFHLPNSHMDSEDGIIRTKGYTLVDILLVTGRTHQIRVHLSHMGHPVAGDHLYGGEKIHLIERQALHAKSISFLHPVTGKPVSVEAPMPSDMKDALNKLRKLRK
ncbi:MAG TPA: RluA family pseudouridine synthase [Bacillota bacterium]|nr:RluA family pseudouridine synthase [Bacillota bacterium]HUM56037.1 RluA family pseudouridine synthase [Bacillota bacterium]